MRWRRPAEEELERDIADHLAMETEENMARGMSPEEARYAALRRFGNVARVKEETRRVWGWNVLDTWCADVKHALRRIRRSPGTAALAVFSLALAFAPIGYAMAATNGVWSVSDSNVVIGSLIYPV